MSGFLQWILQILTISGLCMTQVLQVIKIQVKVPTYLLKIKIKTKKMSSSNSFFKTLIIGHLVIFNGVLVYVNYLHMYDRIGFIKYHKSNLSSWSPLIVKGYNRINQTNNLNNLHLPRLITFQCYI